MDTQRLLWGIVAIAGALAPCIGMLIGAVRYRKHGEKIKAKVNDEYKRAQEHGGIKSLYYKHTHKRIYAYTFGIPTVVGLLIGLILLELAFHMM